jgi:hypothetical protein
MARAELHHTFLGLWKSGTEARKQVAEPGSDFRSISTKYLSEFFHSLPAGWRPEVLSSLTDRIQAGNKEVAKNALRQAPMLGAIYQAYGYDQLIAPSAEVFQDHVLAWYDRNQRKHLAPPPSPTRTDSPRSSTA